MKMLFDSVILGIFGLGGSEMIIILFILCFALIPQVFFLLTLQNTLKLISAGNRKMDPGQVWLTFIPLFGLVWQFIVVNRMADSLKAEFGQRMIVCNEDRPGAGLGVTYCILFCCGVIPFIGVLASIGGLVCWIIYWIKIAGYKTKLEQSESNSFGKNTYSNPIPPNPSQLVTPDSKKTNSNKDDVFNQIEKLGKLKEHGLISEEEFLAEKKKLLQ